MNRKIELVADENCEMKESLPSSDIINETEFCLIHYLGKRRYVVCSDIAPQSNMHKLGEKAAEPQVQEAKEVAQQQWGEKDCSANKSEVRKEGITPSKKKE
jgi:hypothetical protein